MLQNSKNKLNEKLTTLVNKRQQYLQTKRNKTEVSLQKTENSIENVSMQQNQVQLKHRKQQASFKLPQIKQYINEYKCISLLENFITNLPGSLSERRHLKKSSSNYLQLTSREKSTSRIDFFNQHCEENNQQPPQIQSQSNQKVNDISLPKTNSFIIAKPQLKKQIQFSNFNLNSRNSIKNKIPQQFQTVQQKVLSGRNKDFLQLENNYKIKEEVKQSNSYRNEKQKAKPSILKQQEIIEHLNFDQQSSSTQETKSVRFKSQLNTDQYGLDELCQKQEQVRTSEREIRPKRLSEIEELRSLVTSEQGEIRSKKNSEFADIRSKKSVQIEEQQEISQKIQETEDSFQEKQENISPKKIIETDEIRPKKPSEGEIIRSKKPSEGGEIRSKKPSEGGEIRSKKPSEGGEIRSKKPSEGGEIRSKQNSIRSKTSSWFSQSSSYTQKSDESHYIWDNTDLQQRGVDLQEIEGKNTIQQFLQFYKMRFGGYPGQHQRISNEDVIKIALNFAKSNKKMFKKYFPTNRIIFEDENDYSSEHIFESDPNYQKFIDYVAQYQQNAEEEEEKQLETIEEISNNQILQAPLILDRRRGLKPGIGFKSQNRLQVRLQQLRNQDNNKKN